MVDNRHIFFVVFTAICELNFSEIFTEFQLDFNPSKIRKWITCNKITNASFPALFTAFLECIISHPAGKNNILPVEKSIQLTNSGCVASVFQECFLSFRCFFFLCVSCYKYIIINSAFYKNTLSL